MPRISVLLPVYNGECYLREAIESILNQTFDDFELIIINDGSTDASRGIILSHDDPRIRLVENEQNLGLPRALNRGLRLAQGEYIARQDADDISHPDRFAKQLGYLAQHPEVVLVSTRLEFIDDARRPITWSIQPCDCTAIRWSLLFVPAIPHAAFMFRREPVLNQVGLYDEALLHGDDYDYTSRIARQFRVVNLDQPLYQCRLHRQQKTRTYANVRDEQVDAISLRNMLDILGADTEDNRAFYPVYRSEDLIALRGLYTSQPSHLDRLDTPQTRQLLMTLLQHFRQVYGIEGQEWQDFSRWLSGQWLTLAHVHLRRRPRLGWWLWWQAVVLCPSIIWTRPAMRLLLKTAFFPVYLAFAQWRPHPDRRHLLEVP